MIAAMKRVFVLLMESDKRKALHDLRKLGLVHIEPIVGKGQEYDDIVASRQSVVDALGILSEYKVDQTEQTLGPREGIDLAAIIHRHDDEAKAALGEALALVREIERIRSWGNFEPRLVAELATKGIPLRFVEMPIKKLSSLPESLDRMILSQGKGMARLALLAEAGIELPLDCVEFRLPLHSLSDLEEDLLDARSRADAARAFIAGKAPLASSLAKALAKIQREEAFEALRSGMDVDTGVSWFSAWVPAADEKTLSAAAAKSGWGLLIDEPLDEEQPPTKIENPAIVRMIQPVFDFLGTVPNYREYDISGLFLVFFTIFFAMIFGDGGYGSLMFIAALALALKSLIAKKPVPDTIRLLLVLAGATVIWGAMTMSWFGIVPEKVPAILRALALPPLSSANPDSGDNVKVLCFMLGLVQLSIAHLKNIRRDFPSPRLLGQVGQLGMVAGMFFLVLNLVISAKKYPLPIWALYLVGGGFVLNFMFAGYVGGKNFFVALGKSILSSMGNIVSVFLGVVNIFADIVSYIRLWAVGLAGLAISQTINNMAGPMFGKAIMFAAGVMLLVFGHGLNVIMSVLSVIVHGVRLNVLEFSGHLGMEWSGYLYEPFKDTVQAERVEIERSHS
jgi:V/A-type H+-transporting ATPase subunit I